MSLDSTGRAHLYNAYNQAYGDVFFRIAGLQEAFNDQLTMLKEKINKGDNITDADLQTFVTKIFDKCYNKPIEPKVKVTVQYLTNKLSYVNKEGQTELENCISKLQNRRFLSPEEKEERVKIKKVNPDLIKFHPKNSPSNINIDKEVMKAPNDEPTKELMDASNSSYRSLTTREHSESREGSNESPIEGTGGKNPLKEQNCFMRFINAIINLFKRLFPFCFKKEETK
jgi:hypothetical protein